MTHFTDSCAYQSSNALQFSPPVNAKLSHRSQCYSQQMLIFLLSPPTVKGRTAGGLSQSCLVTPHDPTYTHIAKVKKELNKELV